MRRPLIQNQEELKKLLDAGINPYIYLKYRDKEAFEKFKSQIWEWLENGGGRGDLRFSLDHLHCLVVEGETFEIKDELKSLKFRWNSVDKQWYREVTSVSEAVSLANKIKELKS